CCPWQTRSFPSCASSTSPESCASDSNAITKPSTTARPESVNPQTAGSFPPDSRLLAVSHQKGDCSSGRIGLSQKLKRFKVSTLPVPTCFHAIERWLRNL